MKGLLEIFTIITRNNNKGFREIKCTDRTAYAKPFANSHSKTNRMGKEKAFIHDDEGFQNIYWPIQEALCSNRNLSATMAMNSEFVGFAFVMLTVYPNRLEIESIFPRLQATSMA